MRMAPLLRVLCVSVLQSQADTLYLFWKPRQMLFDGD